MQMFSRVLIVDMILAYQRRFALIFDVYIGSR